MRFRFSLGTLLLTVLLVAAVAAFLRNWEQWVPTVTFTSDYGVREIGYSPDDKYVYAYGTASETGKYPDVKLDFFFRIHDARTGELLRTLSAKISDRHWLYLTSDFKTLCISTQMDGSDGIRTHAAWDLQTGEDLLLNNPRLKTARIVQMLGDSKTALVEVDYEKLRYQLVRFPSMEVIREFNAKSSKAHWQLYNTDYFALDDGNTTALYDSSGKLRLSQAIKGDSSYVSFLISPQQDKAVVVINAVPTGGSYLAPESAVVFDLSNRAVVKDLSKCVSEPIWTADGSAVCYWTNDGARHLYNVSSRSDVVLDLGTQRTHLLSREGLLLEWANFRAWDVKTGTVRYDLNLHGDMLRSPSEGNYWLIKEPTYTQQFRIVCAETGKDAGRIGYHRWGKQVMHENDAAVFAHGSMDFIQQHRSYNPLMMEPWTCTSYTFWKNKWANKWLGALSMPEFWIMVAIGALLGWNVRRNRKRITLPVPSSTGTDDRSTVT